MVSNWQLAPLPDVPLALSQLVAGSHPALAQLLALRGLDEIDRAQAFLDPDHYTPAAPDELPGAIEAARCIAETLDRGDHVRIWGDFDADGQTSTTVLFTALRFLGRGVVSYRLPERGDGHGLCERAVREAIADGVDLLVTCDTGVSDADVVDLANSLGLDVVITDHHDPPEQLPNAMAIANPKLLPKEHPLHELAGVGAAYMVVQVLLRERPGGPVAIKELLDLVALGLVADVATQVNDVRYLIQRGTAAMRQTSRPGLLALAEAAGVDIRHLDEQALAYQFGPRLNAAGRLADPELGMRLLLSTEESIARACALDLEALNQDRRARTESVMVRAREIMRRHPDLEQQPALMLIDDQWEAGVAGLVAGRLANEVGKPVMLITRRPDGTCIASGRSVEGYDIHGAILSQSHLMERQGGHPMAAGFTVVEERLQQVVEGMIAWFREQPGDQVAPTLDIELSMPWAEISLDLAHAIARLKPFGEGNRPPMLLIPNGVFVRAEDISRRRETPHRRLIIAGDDSEQHQVLWFNAGDLPHEGDRIDLACQIRLGMYRGQEQMSLRLVDWRLCEEIQSAPHQILIDGVEIIDRRVARGGQSRDQHLEQLATTYGSGLAVWAEGDHGIGLGKSRAQLSDRPCITLAVATPPPDAQTFSETISRSGARRVVLLPMDAPPALKPNTFIRRVAAMINSRLAQNQSELDMERMAAHLGTTTAAILLALQALEAMGQIHLDGAAGHLVVSRPAPDQAVVDNPSRRGHIRAALASALREISAYQRAFMTMPTEMLLAL